MLLYPLRHQWVAHCNKDYCASTAHNGKRVLFVLSQAPDRFWIALRVLGW